MSKDNFQTPLATAYAEALLQLANEANIAASVGEELNGLRQIIEADPQFAQLLADPAISTEERGQLLHRVFDGRASTLMSHFLGLVNEKGRLALLSAFDGAYNYLLDQQQGIVEVDVTVAQALGDDQLETVRLKVGESLKREAVVHQSVDPSIIGGLVLRVQDQLIDGSVRAQLSAMRQRLMEARPV